MFDRVLNMRLCFTLFDVAVSVKRFRQNQVCCYIGLPLQDFWYRAASAFFFCGCKWVSPNLTFLRHFAAENKIWRKSSFWRQNETLSVILHYLHNFKKVKKTDGIVLLLVKLQAEVNTLTLY